MCHPPVPTVVGDSGNGAGSVTVGSLTCANSSVVGEVPLQFDPALAPALAGLSFEWLLDPAEMAVQSADGTVLYQATQSTTVATQGLLPATTLTSTDATKYPGTLTVTGGYSCPQPPDMGGPQDMATSSGAPVITGFMPSSQKPQGPVQILGRNFTNPQNDTTPYSITWGSTPGGTVGFEDDGHLDTSVPTAASPGTVTVVLTTGHGTASGTFTILPP